MMVWNEGQQNGIDASGEDILVSASAGTGKTAVLVERLIQRLSGTYGTSAPLEMDRFLFVTYTNGAAQEMTRRVRQGIEDLAQKDPGNRVLAKQRRLLGQAAISTMHSFCLDLIRAHAKTLGIDPKSRVLDETERALMQEESLTGYLEECYAKNEPEFAALADVFGGERSDDTLKKLVYRVLEFAVAQPFPLKWIENSIRLYQGGQGVNELALSLYKQVMKDLQAIRNELDKGIALAKELESLKKYEDCLRGDQFMIAQLMRAEEWDSLVEGMTGGRQLFTRLPSIPQKISKYENEEMHMRRMALQPTVKEIRDACRENFGSLADA
ncbi:MAG: UvrD-helicase domain-containing protein, partial [Clostridiales bacterium]|nr:UvrD-helicase domain-containing protein [Clostridiales bacterium]